MVVPVQQQARQQLRFAQERTVRRRGAAHDKVVATSGAGVAAVSHELLGAQARLERCVVQEFGVGHQFFPVGDRVHVDLDHAGVRRHAQQFHSGVTRRRVTLDHQLQAEFFRSCLDGSEQIQVMFQLFKRRHEHIQHA